MKKFGGGNGYVDLFWPGIAERDLPRYVLVCDFARFRLFDLSSGETHEFPLAQLYKNVRLFGFIAGYQTQVIKPQDPINIKAAERMGRLHDQLKAIGYEGRPLELYLVRLLFCLFAEDTRLIEAILKAQGYTTWRSPEGTDGGADILAGSGPQGFASPRLCVEVKSEDGAIDRPTVDKLLGAMTKFNADQGLFVAWNGFKGNVQKELSTQFFRLRLWPQKDVLEQLFDLYERLDEDLKAELPLKRVWMVAAQGE